MRRTFFSVFFAVLVLFSMPHTASAATLSSGFLTQFAQLLQGFQSYLSSQQQGAARSNVSENVAAGGNGSGGGRIDTLSNVTITNPTIVGGSISNTSGASSGSFSGTITNAINSAVGTIVNLTSSDLTATNLSAGSTTVASLRINSLDCSAYGNGGKLTTDAFGVVVCAADQGGAGGTVGGINTQVQFNDSGSFGGSASFVFDKIANRLTLLNASTTNLSVAGSLVLPITSALLSTDASGKVVAAAAIGNAQLQNASITVSSGSGLSGGGSAALGSSVTLSLDNTGNWAGTLSGNTAAQLMTNGFSTTSASYWRDQNPFFSTTSAAYWESTQTTDNLTQGASNKYYGTTLFARDLSATTTSALAEGTNQYFSPARADARINATSTISTLLAAPNLGTVATSLSGLIKATSGSLSAAVAGTDYAPATAGSSLLLGNGTGGTASYGGTSCTNQFLRSVNGAGVATCANVSLASDITGTLDFTNGGTGTTTQVTNGVTYFDGASITSGTSLTFDGTILTAPYFNTENANGSYQINGIDVLRIVPSVSYDFAVGQYALANAASGGYATALGDYASFNNTAPLLSTAIGAMAGYGSGGLYSNDGSTAIGAQAGLNFQAGSDNNTLVGAQAGVNITTGSGNLVLGSYNGLSSWLTSGSDNIIIGHGVSFGTDGTANNQLNIGNLLFGSGVTASNIASNGSIGIGTSTPWGRFSIVGAEGQLNPLLAIASSTGGTVFSVSSSGNIGIGSSTPWANLSVQGAAGQLTPLFAVASSTGDTMFSVSSSGNVGLTNNTVITFGSTYGTGSNGYGIRENGGLIEFRNAYASTTLFSSQWTPLTAAASTRYQFDTSGFVDTGATLPVALSSSQVAIIGDYVYLFGGDVGGSESNNIYRAPISNPTAWVDTGATLPSTLTRSQVLVVGDYVYLFGGVTGGIPANVIYRAPVSNPTSWNNTGAVLPGSIFDEQATVLGNYIYLFGGGGTGQNIYKAPIADPTNWSDTGYYLPGGVAGGVPTQVIGDYVYLFGVGGGLNIYRAPVSDVESSWVDLGALLPVGVAYTQSAIIGDYVYLFGSNGGADIWRAPVSDPTSWSKIGNTYHGSGGVLNPQLAIIGDHVYQFGGGVAIYSAPITNNASYASNWTMRPNAPSGPWFYATSSNQNISYLSGGIGIGTTDPTAQLHTTGTVRFSNFGAGSLTTDASGNLSVSSDERLKNINGTFTRGLADLIKLNPILYHWNATSGLDMSTQYAGFSAQNVQSAIPEAVGSSTSGFLTLQDRPLIAAVVNAIKDIGTIAGSFKERLVMWLGASDNGLTKVHTDQLCIGATCVTESQLKALLATAGVSGASGGTGMVSLPTPIGAPIVELVGSSTLSVPLNTSFVDPGARITGPVEDLNLGIVTYLNGIKKDPFTFFIDTSATSTNTIEYVVTDQFGTAATATRTVVVE